MQLYYGDLIPYLVPLLKGLAVSIGVSVVATVAGGAFGILLYVGRTSRVSIVRVASSTYIEVIRNTPLLLQLYLVYFALPQAGVNLDPVAAGILALSVNNAAYLAEIYRAGFQSVPAGLREAGAALGLSPRDTFWQVLFPPAMRNVLPAITNQTILLFLASSITSVVSLPDLMHVMMGITSTTFRTIEAFTVGGLLYFAVAFLIAGLSRLVETRFIKWKVA
ncbi:polar amino acid ABC transporter permease [Mycobacterium vulneris]|uniref:Amino acid ABC transporter permease n=1 Tax=Mycolicibacterium porcinum TaxID=39693 RepID=A0AAW5T9T8_9MYCO|nr:amino acid ABC transporter permease [Mycolicibacterium porcinum]OCB53755.1 polar amino acid ABC transporter permease [Mycolicibacterium vulneris]MCV7391353.1 amino acid ABC transporter permease [Mycolicibacterium porcinum]OCB65001.1 polar amino acid ABC transporter permease [Mycolicibacterium vulneris]ODR16315.1 polar amino acid ABC transporter permease [Mycolicibacterium porcinum]ORB41881.1 polar amino acid ABC transporter permease [Mycolicibacterium porcinum]